MLMRSTLFLITNLAVLFVLGILLNFFGLNQPGMDLTPLLFMAGIMAKRSAKARVISAPADDTEKWLMSTVGSLTDQAGIGMPEVAIFDSPAPNAFATGATKNSSLVAVSTGLLSSMNKDEVEAVLAHEVSHITNGDMVTLSLIQGVVNTFVIVLSQTALVDRRQGGGYNSRGYGFGRGRGYSATYMIAQLGFGFLATLIVRWFSRWREYRADAGAAALAGHEKMISALERLKSLSEPAQLPVQMQAFGINGGLFGAVGLKKLTMTHPSLENRIRALREGAKNAERSL